MLKQLTFRKKIFFSQVLLFLVFVAFLFPLIEQTVREIVHDSLEERAKHLIQKIQKAPSEKALIQELRNQELFVFFRVTLTNAQNELLYDASIERHLNGASLSRHPFSRPEIDQALQEGKGYREGYSQIFDQRFVYLAIAFDFQGNKYVLRAGFPFIQIKELTRNFELGFLFFSSFLLLIFAGVTSLIFTRLSRPIKQITQAIKQDPIPEIPEGPDDFGYLAKTINSLSARIQSQINSLTAEKSEKEAILESLGEGVIAVDAAMQIGYINFIGSKMLGLSRKHLLGKTLATLPRTSLIEKAQELLKACQATQSILTDTISLADGKKLYLDLIAAPKTKGSGAIIVFQDKSSHYKVLEMGKDFVANASHELRTPITIIRGFAETLQDLPEISPEMLSDITEKIVRNCQRMDTLVKNLLTLADIDNIPETRFKECNLGVLIDNCRHMLLSIYPDAEISVIKSQEEILISADADLLELAIMNLLDNAAKYSPSLAVIAVTLKQKGSTVTITIADKGIGIPEADLEQIFERFYTVNKAHSRRLGGAGLGLSIVKTIIEKHAGTISATSTVGHGTTFVISVPGHQE